MHQARTHQASGPHVQALRIFTQGWKCTIIRPRDKVARLKNANDTSPLPDPPVHSSRFAPCFSLPARDELRKETDSAAGPSGRADFSRDQAGGCPLRQMSRRPRRRKRPRARPCPVRQDAPAGALRCHRPGGTRSDAPVPFRTDGGRGPLHYGLAFQNSTHLKRRRRCAKRLRCWRCFLRF